jgi:hypothetical protein
MIFEMLKKFIVLSILILTSSLSFSNDFTVLSGWGLDDFHQIQGNNKVLSIFSNHVVAELCFQDFEIPLWVSFPTQAYYEQDQTPISAETWDLILTTGFGFKFEQKINRFPFENDSRLVLSIGPDLSIVKISRSFSSFSLGAFSEASFIMETGKNFGFWIGSSAKFNPFVFFDNFYLRSTLSFDFQLGLIFGL